MGTFSLVRMKFVLILLQSSLLFLPIMTNGSPTHSFMLPKQRLLHVQASTYYEKCPYLNSFQTVLYQFSTNKSKRRIQYEQLQIRKNCKKTVKFTDNFFKLSLKFFKVIPPGHQALYIKKNPCFFKSDNLNFKTKFKA